MYSVKEGKNKKNWKQGPDREECRWSGTKSKINAVFLKEEWRREGKLSADMESRKWEIVKSLQCGKNLKENLKT